MTQTNEQEPNPYNRNKAWHSDYEEQTGPSADEGFFFPPQTKKEPAKTDKDSEPSAGEQDTSDKGDNPQNHDWKKRYDSLRPELDRLREQVKTLQTEKESSAETSGESNTSLPETPEEVAKLKELDPERFEQLVSLIKYVSGQETSGVHQELEALKQKDRETQKQEAKKEILKAHPDFEQLRESDAFHDWAESKSKVIQDAIYKNALDYKSAIEALDLFKFETGNSVQKNESKNEQEPKESTSAEDAASLVSVRNTDGSTESRKKIWKVSEIKAIPMKRLSDPELLAEIEAAQKEGRIVQG